MLEKPSLSDQCIISWLKTYYGIDVTRLIFLPLGADMNASLYKAEAPDQAYFIKLKLGNYSDTGCLIPELLHDSGIQQIIPPIKTCRGLLIQRLEQFTMIVYPFVRGKDGFCQSLTDQQWITLGKALKHIHAFNVPFSIQSQVRREVYSSQWREVVRTFYRHSEVVPIGDEISLKLWRFMKQNILPIFRLVDRAEQLGQKLHDQSPKCVLCHSDIHAGNVLLDGNDSIYIVDWDEPIMAPKERDLMFIGGGVGNVWNIPLEEHLFYQGYGKTDIDATVLSYYRHERIVEDIAVYGQKLLLSTDGGEDRPVMYQQFVDMFAPQGVVDIAFQTDQQQSL